MKVPNVKNIENDQPYLEGGFEFVFGNDVATDPITQEQSIEINFKISPEIQQNVDSYVDSVFEMIGDILKRDFINQLKQFKTNV